MIVASKADAIDTDEAEEGKGIVYFGTVCSSWVTISRSSTGLSYFLPLGDQSVDSVNKANILVPRTACIEC